MQSDAPATRRLSRTRASFTDPAIEPVNPSRRAAEGGAPVSPHHAAAYSALVRVLARMASAHLAAAEKCETAGGEPAATRTTEVRDAGSRSSRP
jgi:hypothetical protein